MTSDDRPAASASLRERLVGLAPTVVATAVLGSLAFAHLEVSLRRRYALDEYQYAWAGWAIARGQAIYRDFFEHHLPLLHDLLALVWRFLPDDPDRLQTLRWAMLPALALAVVAGATIHRRDAGRWAALAAAPILMAPTLSSMMIEVRPDALSGALFLAAIAALYPPSWSPRRRGLVAGVLLGLAFWGTLKVVYHALPFVAAWLVDVAQRRRGRPCLLGDPIAFFAGFAGVVVAGALRLAAAGALGDAWRLSVAFAFTHQRVYPGFSWIGNVEQFLRHSAWLVAAAAVGVAWTLRRLMADRPADDPDWLLVAALPASFASFAWQSAPYLYSLIPFTLVMAVFAGRGVAALARWSAARGRAFVAVFLVLVLGGELLRTRNALATLAAEDNSDDRRVLALLGELTAPGDPVFHVWGAGLARPSPSYFYFLEAVTMIVEDARLRRELVPAMVEKGVTVYLHHDLFPRLVPELRRYLVTHFLPLDARVWVYGRRLTRDDDGVLRDDFDAVREGRYFLAPMGAFAAGARLTVDGHPVAGPIFDLARGRHRIELSGFPAEAFVVWLPRDGRPFLPRPELLPER